MSAKEQSGVLTEEERAVFVAEDPEAFTYDADGNLTGDGLWTYEYDAENRLTTMTMMATPPGSMTCKRLEFEYDYLSRRVEKKVFDNWNGTSETEVTHLVYVYDGFNLMAELDANDSFNVERHYVWGLDMSGTTQGAGGIGGLLRLTDEGTGKDYLPGYDGSGNLTVLLDAADGSVEAAYEYSPFGKLLRATGPYADINPIRFSTKYYDAESNLYYYGYRYYSPSQGRFINRDPIGESGGLNLYGFVGNDPINRADALGLCDWGWSIGGSIFGGLWGDDDWFGSSISFSFGGGCYDPFYDDYYNYVSVGGGGTSPIEDPGAGEGVFTGTRTVADSAFDGRLGGLIPVASEFEGVHLAGIGFSIFRGSSVVETPANVHRVNERIRIWKEHDRVGERGPHDWDVRFKIVVSGDRIRIVSYFRANEDDIVIHRERLEAKIKDDLNGRFVFQAYDGKKYEIEFEPIIETSDFWDKQIRSGAVSPSEITTITGDFSSGDRSSATDWNSIESTTHEYLHNIGSLDTYYRQRILRSTGYGPWIEERRGNIMHSPSHPADIENLAPLRKSISQSDLVGDGRIVLK